MIMGFGFSYWGMVAYAVIFIVCYFIWAINKSDKEDQEGGVN